MPKASNTRSGIYYAIAAIGVRATLVLSLVTAATAILLPRKRRTLRSKQSDRLQGLANSVLPKISSETNVVVASRCGS